MNYLYLVIESMIVFTLMVLFYKINKKDGLYMYIALMSSVLSFILVGAIEIMAFQINLGVPIVMGIFICSNIIIQRYGIDEVKRIITTFVVPYLMVSIVVNLTGLVDKYGIDLSGNYIYDLIFSYSLSNLRCVIAGLISMGIMLWIGTGIYYSIRKNKNILTLSNLATIFVIGFIESLVFVLIAYTGNFSAIEIFGMASFRYILEVVLAIIGLIPVYILVKFIDK